MRKALTVLSAVLLVFTFVSCSQDSGTDDIPAENQIISNISDNKIQDVELTRNTTVTLTELEKNGLYGIYPENIDRNISSRAAVNGLVPTQGGTYLHLSDGTDFSFLGSDVGIAERGKVKVMKYQPVTEDRAIDTDGTPLYWAEDYGGVYPVFEEYYIVNLEEERLDPSRVALLNYSTGSGSFSTDYGVIDPSSGSLSRDPEFCGLMDLSSKDEIGIFNQVVKREGHRVQEIIPLNPVKLELDEVNTLELVRYLYEVDGVSCTGEMVLELNIGENSVWDYRFSGSVTDGRKADGGYRQPYIFPISYDEDTSTVLLYIGEVEEDFIFEIITEENIVSPGTIKLRQILDEERKKIHFVDVEDGMRTTINVNGKDAFTPVVFTSDPDTLHEMQVRGDFTDNGFNIRLAYGHIGNRGYSQFGLNNHEIKDDDFSNDVLEYLVIRNPEQIEGGVTLSFSKTGFSQDGAKDVIVDASGLSDVLSDVSFSWNNNLVFENLETGSVYGMYLGENISCSDERLIRVNRDFYVFLALDEVMRFDASDFEVAGEETLQVMKLNVDENQSESTDTMDAIMKTEDGDLYLNCFRFEIEEDGEYALINQSSGSGSMSSSWYFINCETGEEIYSYDSYVYDFTGIDNVILVSNIRLREGKCENNFSLMPPVYLNPNEFTAFTLPGFFKGDAPGNFEFVLEMKFDEGDLDISALRYPNVTDQNGQRVPYFYPFSVNHDTNTVLIYGGSPEGNLSYVVSEYHGSVNSGKMRIRGIFDEEKNEIELIALNDSSSFEKEISFNEGPKLVIFESDDLEDAMNWKVSCDKDVKADVALKLYREDSTGSSSCSLYAENGYQYTLEPDEILEAILIDSSAEGTVTLKFEKI